MFDAKQSFVLFMFVMIINIICDAVLEDGMITE